MQQTDKVLRIRIETIYNFRTQDKLSTKVSIFFYLKIGSFKFSSHLKGSVGCQRIAFSSSYANGKSCVFLRA